LVIAIDRILGNFLSLRKWSSDTSASMRFLVAISFCIVAILTDAYAFDGRHVHGVWREALSFAYQANSKIGYWISNPNPTPVKVNEQPAAPLPQKR
jgi:hypothetical protein